MKRLEQAQARMQNIRDQLGAIESRMDARSLIHQWMNEAEVAFHCLTPSAQQAPADSSALGPRSISTRYLPQQQCSPPRRIEQLA